MRAIVFDLDGTLIDSAPDIAAALNTVLAAEGLPALSLPQVISFIGNGVAALVAKARRFYQIPDDRQEPMLQAMLAAMIALNPPQTRLYPHVRETLTALKDQGFTLGICTNKSLAPAQKVLRDMGLAAFFDGVIGGDSLPTRKPDPAMLHAAFAGLGAEPFLYIGDSGVDAETAARAGVPFGFFSEGYCHVPEESLSKTFRFSDYRDLPAAIAALARPETGNLE